MPDAPWKALVGLELRRARPVAQRTVGWAAVLFLAAFLVAPERTRLLGAILGIFGASFAFTIPLQGVRDRMEGGLEFLSCLPVDPRVVAGARLAACGATAVLAGALCTGSVAILVAPSIGVALTPAWAVSTFLMGSVVAASVSGLLSAVLLRFRQSQLQLLPAVGTGAILVLIVLGDRMFPELDDVLVRAVLQPWFPAAAWFLAVTGALGAGLLAFHLLAASVREFRPERDRLDF